MKMETRQATLDHLNLTVTSFERTVAWYKKVFGFEVVEQGMEEDGPWGVLKNGDSMLCVYESPKRDILDSERFHQIYHFGLRIENREQWEQTLRQESIPTHYGSPVQYPHSTSWYVTDPSGYRIEVALWNKNEIRF